MILVTGGTGLVGSHLLFKLTSEGEKVKAIYRTEKSKNHVKHIFSYYTKNAELLFNNIQWEKADVTDVPSLEPVFKDVTHVYHCAGLVSFNPKDLKSLRKINIEGTANIVNLSIANNVKKLCHVSSIATLDAENNNPEFLINEDADWHPEKDHTIYAISKYGGELEVWRGSQEGLDVVIVNPGIILGPGFWEKSGSSGLFYKIYKGLRFYTNGSSGYVDVNDVTEIMFKLMLSKSVNERFIIVAENYDFYNFISSVSKHLNMHNQKKEIKLWVLNILYRISSFKQLFFKSDAILTKQMVNTLTSFSNYDNSKSIERLDYKYKSVEKSIADNCNILIKEIT